MRLYIQAVMIFTLSAIFSATAAAQTHPQPNIINTNSYIEENPFDIWSVLLDADHKEEQEHVISSPSSVLLDVPLISQMPELPRGCEVTSLAMLLRYKNIHVSKMTLANEIKKDPSPYKRVGQTIYFGNPNYGFVGSMTTFSKPGFGVFHGPVYALANRYLKGNALDLTGSDFQTILQHLDQKKPVWVISTSTFNRVPDRYWQIWQTRQGPVRITYKEHSVLLTGHDQKYIYFNDPLANIKNRKVLMSSFIKGWEQYGKQAITYK